MNSGKNGRTEKVNKNIKNEGGVWSGTWVDHAALSFLVLVQRRTARDFLVHSATNHHRPGDLNNKHYFLQISRLKSQNQDAGRSGVC
jgi:hypothetical protein